MSYPRRRRPGVDDLLGRGVYYGAAPGEAALHLAQYAACVTVLVRSDSLGRRMSRYLVDRIEAHERISVLTETELLRAEGDSELRAPARHLRGRRRTPWLDPARGLGRG